MVKVFFDLDDILKNQPEVDQETRTAIEEITPSSYDDYNDSRVYIPSMVEQSRHEYLGAKDDPEHLAQWQAKRNQEFIELNQCCKWQKNLAKNRRGLIDNRLGYPPLDGTQMLDDEFTKESELYVLKPFAGEDWDEMEMDLVRICKGIQVERFKGWRGTEVQRPKLRPI
ncbi:hypothetical protein E1B28_002920 [Marasmius oreades]|uniref:Uncharacterized protein n=1 Tax=Marasmius oreades TaxID=181124 RepID=A0A9P7UMW1_9AGAR|nr:uncharacterized protein E1B28_002920 [Marasmius oreades]KAG7085354.1 hypothetical protein E1B28_002920 [Marasmius oreades]